MSDQYIVFADDSRWRAARAGGGATAVEEVDFAPDSPMDARVTALALKLAEMGRDGEPVLLALPSTWCLCGSINTGDLPRSNRRGAMGYKLEEHLPVSIEDVTADYVSAGAGAALGVCTETSRLEPLVRALAAGGLKVRHVSPGALLAASWAAARHDNIDAVLTASAAPGPDGRRSYDLVELSRGKPGDWHWLADDEDAVRERLKALAVGNDNNATVAVIGDDEALRLCGSVTGIECVDADPAGAGAEATAAQLGADVLDQQSDLWVDLRCRAMTTGSRQDAFKAPVTALVVALALLMAAACAVLWWRGTEYQNLAADYAAQQRKVFREALPKQRRVPRVGITYRLRSELKRLATLGGKGDNPDAGRPEGLSALEQLQAVLSGLPKNMRYRVLDLSIRPELVSLKGEARSIPEAGNIAAGLRRTGKYEVDPPNTLAMKDGGFSFRFSAKPVSAGKGGKQ